MRLVNAVCHVFVSSPPPVPLVYVRVAARVNPLHRDCANATRAAPGQVTLRGKQVPVSGFEDYVRLFRSAPASDDATTAPADGAAATAPAPADGVAAPPAVCYVRVNRHWEVAAAVVEDADSGDVVSFVNGTCTLRGGSHVAYVSEQLCKRAAELIAKRNPGARERCSASRGRALRYFFWYARARRARRRRRPYGIPPSPPPPPPLAARFAHRA